ncbi:MAG: glucose 1-dehydrogenase [Deltaproteobacteria bacterium]|nr:glucose 1-dehydrogenase [Candidatus Zymogenaceae bacterium]
MDKNLFSLKGKRVLVTGGSRGIGLEIAVGLAEAGAQHIVICGRKQEALGEARQTIEKKGAKVSAVTANVGNAADVDGLFDKIGADVGGLDIVVNNVGMNIFTPSVVDADISLWDKVMDVNLKAVFLTSRRAVPLMKEAGGGAIINISTVAARKATPGLGIYGIAKAGVEMLTKTLAVELAPYSIRVNAIALAMVKTKFSEPLWSNADLRKQIELSNPMHRIGEPEEVVGTALFLASNASSFMTGSILMLDGGTTA